MPSTGGSRVELPKPSLLQEAIDHASMHNWVPAYRALILSIIAHVRQNLGVEDAARRQDEKTPDG